MKISFSIKIVLTSNYGEARKMDPANEHIHAYFQTDK